MINKIKTQDPSAPAVLGEKKKDTMNEKVDDSI
jgi:hypothetical protein